MKSPYNGTIKKTCNPYFFMIIIILLITIGTIFIYSSSSIYALEKHGVANYFVKKQLLGVLLGTIACVIGRIIPLKWLYTSTPLLFCGSLIVTGLSLLTTFSNRIHGASRWLAIGNVSFQPSELLKIGFILGLAYFLDKRTNHTLSSFWQCGILFFLLIIPSLLLLAQPDFGCTVVLITTAILLFFIAHINLKNLILGTIALIPIGILLIIQKPYRLKRIFTFLDPWQDPRGNGFQIIQSFIAIGSGHISGVGIGGSKQKFFYLPMQHTDFIFSIIAEEIGFIGATGIIMLYIMLLFNGLRLACHLKKTFYIFTTIGFSIWITLQAIINIAVTTGLAPTKGVGLPFISYGNSALITNLFLVGIIINMVLTEQAEQNLHN